MDLSEHDGETQEPAEEKQERVNLQTMANIEEVVNEYAKTVCSKHGVRPAAFRVHLETQLSGIMAIRRGPIVQIHLKWPDAQPHINTLLGDVFRTLRTNKLQDSLAVELAAHVRSRKLENRKWHRKTFGDEAEIFPDLLPKYRLRESVRTEYTMKDSITGISVCIAYEGERSHWDVTNEARHKLSRLVRLHEDELEAERQAREDAGEQPPENEARA